MKILIVEDTRELGTSLVRYLAAKDIRAELVLDGIEGLYKASTEYYDVIILDINLPRKDGLEICRELRRKEKDVPIIMLTSRSGKDDIITGLEAWADDYLVKPFDYEILVARLEALTRRNLKNKSTDILRAWNFTLNLEILSVEDTTHKNIHLSHLEFQLLKYFAQNKWRVIARQELYEKVWGEFDGDMMFSKTIDVYIGYLRKKLGPDIVETKKWFGYMMK
jgi:two-component system OmpR family response regulator